MSDAQAVQARSAVYALLAVGFAYPVAEEFAAFADGGLAADFDEALGAAAPELVADFRAFCRPALRVDGGFESFESDYLSTFETDVPRPSVSLYEGSYLPGGDKPGLLLELKEFYRVFGLGVAGDLHELEDRLSVELEFMHFLAAKHAEAEAAGAGARPYILAQRDFLQRHLDPWLPKLCQELERHQAPAFFAALAQAGAHFITADLAKLEARLARQAAAV